MKASEVMTRNVITVGPKTSVRDIAALMAKNRISGLPVVDEAGKLMGILSETDLMHRAETGTERRHKWWLGIFVDDDRLAREYAAAHAHRAEDMMTRQVVTVEPDVDLGEVTELLQRRNLKRLPVVQGGQLVGIITRGDLVRALLANLAAAPSVAPTDSAAILQAIEQRMRRQNWLDSSLVTVTVNDGIAEVSGLAASGDQRRALRLLVEDTPGVARVDDRMQVKPAAPMV